MRLGLAGFRIALGKKIGLQRIDRRPLLELAQLLPRSAHDGIRNTGQRSDLDAVALVGRAFLDGMQEDDSLTVFDGIRCTLARLAYSLASRVSSK